MICGCLVHLAVLALFAVFCFELAEFYRPGHLPIDVSLQEALAEQGLTIEQAGFITDMLDPALADKPAREAVSPGTGIMMRLRVLEVLRTEGRPMAAEEIADVLGGVSHHTITPRLSELEASGLAERTDERHQNRSGKTAARFRISKNADGIMGEILENTSKTSLGKSTEPDR